MADSPFSFFLFQAIERMIGFVMLCNYCKILDFDAALDHNTGALHHESYADLVASAKSGCQLCTWIHEDWMNNAEQYGDDGRLRCLYNDVDSCLYWYLGDLNGDPIAVTYISTTDGKYFSQSVQSHLGLRSELVLSADLSSTCSDDPMGSVLRSRPIPLDARSDESFSRAQAWVAACETDHKDCIQNSEHRLPTRVVDVGDSVTPPSLLETNGQQGRWVALSYCWGEKPPLKTKLSTLSAFCNELRPNLPMLFQDAIFAVKRLGYQYLWIDALCVLQDSGQDWQIESVDMGRIFKEAAMVVVAEAATDSSAGLFNSTNEGKDNARITISSYSSQHGTHGNLILGPPVKDHETSKGPLSTRAWTLQEEVLSSRNLRFASGRIWWQCWSMQRNERFPYGPRAQNLHEHEWGSMRHFPLTSEPRRIRGMSKARQDAYYRPNQCWYRTVNDYCRRGIRFEEDILPAISCLAKGYRRHLKQEYAAGLWRSDMYLGLLWCIPWPGAAKTPTYVAPSWSWATLRLPKRLLPRASAYGPRNVYHRQLVNYPPRHTIAAIRTVGVIPLHQDIFGQVRAEFIEITAPCHETCRCNIPLSFFDCHQLDNQDTQQIYDIFLEGCDFTQTADRALHESCTTERIMEQKCCQSTDVIHKGCVLVHIATQESRTLAFTLILEVVPPAENGEVQRSRISSTLDDLGRPQKKSRARALMNSGMAKGNSDRQCSREGKQRSTQKDERLQARRRIGLAILRETTPTSAI